MTDEKKRSPLLAEEDWWTVWFIMAVVSLVFASNGVSKTYGLSYAAWALVLRLIISNTMGTPGRPLWCCSPTLCDQSGWPQGPPL